MTNTATDVAVYEEPARQSQALAVYAEGRTRTEQALAVVPAAMELADALSKSNFLPSSYRGKPAEILAALLYAHELDLPPMMALQTIYVVDGRPSLSSEVMRALVTERGHEMWFEEASTTKVVCAARRAEWPADRVVRVTWTMDDAKAAGLATKEVWRKYPRNMLKARASSELCRDVFGDVIRGLSWSTEEYRDGSVPAEDEWAQDAPAIEAGDVVAPEGAPPAPPPSSGQRKPPAAKRTAARKAPPKKADTPAAKAQPAQLPPLPGETAPIPAPVASSEPPADTDVDDVVDAQIVEETPPGAEQEPTAEEEADARHADTVKRRSQMIVIRCHEVLGKSDDLRHHLIAAATGGRTESSTQVTSDECDLVLKALQRIADAEVVLELDEEFGESWVLVEVAGDPDALDDDETDEVPLACPDDGEAWRAALKSMGRKIPAVMKEAQRLATEEGVTPVPSTLEELAGSEVALRVWLWVTSL